MAKRKTARKTSRKPVVPPLTDEQRMALYRAVPQKDIRELSGWQTKSLHDVQNDYGLPIGGPKTDLEVFFHALRQFLIRHGKAIRESQNPKLLDELRAVKVQVARLELAKLEGGLVPIEEVHDVFNLCGMVIRQAGMTVEKKWPEAAEVYREAWDDCEQAVAQLGSGEPENE